MAYLVLMGLLSIQWSCHETFYVDVNGSDSTGNGSAISPWRTLYHALLHVKPGEGSTIRLSSGMFIEKSFLKVGSGINIIGDGIGVTIIKPDTTLFFVSDDWHFDKFLFTLSDSGGHQSLQNFSIDGREKRLYGGILVRNRSNVLLKGLGIENTYFTGIWLWHTRDCRITEVRTKDNAMGSKHGASASILLTDGIGLQIDHNNIDEAHGQALEVVNGRMYDLKLHDNRFSVDPRGNWESPDGQIVPNLAVEFYNAELKNCVVYNNYFDNNLSLVMGEKFRVPTGIQTVRVYNNYFDLVTRARGKGHAIELTVHDAEIDHNYFRGGTTGIANWDASDEGYVRHNWLIHHNIFYGIYSQYPSAIIAMFRHGVNNAHIYNNTVELTENATVNFIEVNNGGVADHVKIDNNLIINSSASHNWYPSKFISTINKGRFQNSIATNNFFQDVELTDVPGVHFAGNANGDPLIRKKGRRPFPYYKPAAGSPLIDKGIQLLFPYEGNAPEIGALEYNAAGTQTVFKNVFIRDP